MDHFNHTTEFIILCISNSLLSIFFIIALLAAWRKRAQSREKEFLKIMSADKEKIYQQLASELHDNTSNLIATAIAYVHKLKRDSIEQRELTEKELLSLLERIHIETHDISQSLHANFVMERGLIPLMEQELKRISKLGSLETKFKVQGFPQKIPSTQKIIIFRIFQEAIMNSFQHASASQIEVKINYTTTGDFELSIRDNGIGFKNESIRSNTGKGMSNMKSRALQLSGQLKIVTQPKNGTLIHLYIHQLLPAPKAKKRII